MQPRIDANPEYYFDPNTRRYRYRDSKKFAPKEAILGLTRSYLVTKQEALRDLGRRYNDGSLGAIDFQIKAANILKEIHLAQATLAADGTENLTSRMLGLLGSRLKAQYYAGKDPLSGQKFGLKYLFRDLFSGQVSPAQLVNRLGMFADSGKGTYWAIATEKSKNDGKTQARRLLGAAEHCQQCPQYAARGWVNLSDAILPTERCDCRNRCKCSIEFR